MARRLLLIVAAGSGQRLGRGEPKALVPLAGRPLLSWTVESFAEPRFDGAVVAGPAEHLEDVRALVPPCWRVIAGGRERGDSVRLGVAALAAQDGDLVCIHDAARPFVAAEETERVLAAAAETGAAIAATPIVDTVKRVEGRRIAGTLDRNGLYGAATPQAFRADVLARALAGGVNATDEAGLCETLGIPVAVVPVSRRTFKITTPEDLELAELVAAARAGAGRP